MRKGFTLVELIFVIVIIGILAAAAIPQFTNLKQSAEANNVVKTTVDGASSAVSAAVNQLDLEDADDAVLELDDLVQINGKGWSYAAAAGFGQYAYEDPANVGSDVATIDFNATGRTVIYAIDCGNFNDAQSDIKCGRALGDTVDTQGTTTTVTLTF